MEQMMIILFSYLILVIAGFILKIRNLATKENALFLGQLSFFIALPCLLIISSRIDSFTSIHAAIFLVGLGANLTTNIMAYFMVRKKKHVIKARMMLNMSGYSAMLCVYPFITSLFGKECVSYALMFILGNGLMAYGGNFCIAHHLYSGVNEVTFSSTVKRLISLWPFDVFVLSFLFMILGIPVPRIIQQAAAVGANSVPFLLMIMIGILAEPRLTRANIRRLRMGLLGRYAISAVLGVLIIFAFPMDLKIKKMMLLCLFAPASFFNAVYDVLLFKENAFGADYTLITLAFSLVLYPIIYTVF